MHARVLPTMDPATSTAFYLLLLAALVLLGLSAREGSRPQRQAPRSSAPIQRDATKDQPPRGSKGQGTTSRHTASVRRVG